MELIEIKIVNDDRKMLKEVSEKELEQMRENIEKWLNKNKFKEFKILFTKREKSI